MARSYHGNMGYFWEKLAAFWLSQQQFSMGHVSRSGLATLGPEGWVTEAPSHWSSKGNLNHALQSTNARKYLCKKIRWVSSLAIFQRAEQAQKTNYIYCLRKIKVGNLAMCLC